MCQRRANVAYPRSVASSLRSVRMSETKGSLFHSDPALARVTYAL